MPRIASVLTSLLAVATLTLWGAPAALAVPDVSDAAAALRSGDPVYSAPDAENALTGAEVAALSDQILASDVPQFIAVLPESATGGGTSDDVLVALQDEVGLAGVYAVIVGDQFRAGSTAQSVADLATQAFRSQRDAGAAAVLSEFVTLTDQRFSSTPSGDSGGSSSTGGGGSGVLVVLLVMVIGGAVVVVVMSRRARKTRELQLTAVRRTVDEDITEYGERLGSFSLADPDFDDATRADMQRALDSYDRAKSSVALMRSPADAVNVTTALEDGRYALACVDARLARQPLPERRPPCFVDPRHGPSVSDVVWAPPGLGERDVPMCAACRTTVETGGQPHSLEVATVGGGNRPYYQAGPEYGAYAQGYYSPFAGVMTAVVMGTMLSSMWHMPGVTGSSGMDSAGFGGGDSSGFGGFGGGGGDFGGGDFGGGDF